MNDVVGLVKCVDVLRRTQALAFTCSEEHPRRACPEPSSSLEIRDSSNTWHKDSYSNYSLAMFHG